MRRLASWYVVSAIQSHWIYIKTDRRVAAPSRHALFLIRPSIPEPFLANELHRFFEVFQGKGKTKQYGVAWKIASPFVVQTPVGDEARAVVTASHGRIDPTSIKLNIRLVGSRINGILATDLDSLHEGSMCSGCGQRCPLTPHFVVLPYRGLDR